MNTSEDILTPGRDEDGITLKLLTAVEGNSALTQRALSRDLGIALGLANAYLRRCIKKGLIKAAQAPSARYAYYLTPHGFAEKGRLTAEYLRQSFNLVRAARREYGDIFAHCVRRGWTGLAAIGAGEIAEIAVLSAGEHPVTLLGVIDAARSGETICGLPVVRNLDDLAGVQAAIITDLADPQAAFDRLRLLLPGDRVLYPRFMNISAGRPAMADEDCP